jgi:hypothetical protein
MAGRAILAVRAAVLLVPLAPTSIAAQAWVQPAGGYYLKLSASYLRTTEQYDALGDIEPFATEDSTATDYAFRDLSLNAYLEYAITGRYSLVATLPFKISTTMQTELPALPGDAPQEVSLTNGGLADFSVSIRAGLMQSSTALAIQAGAKLPLGYEQSPDNGGPALGTGEVDAEINLLFGQSFYPLAAYVGAGVGYRVRGDDDFDDEVPFSVEAGYTAGALFLKLRFDGLHNVGGIAPDPAPTAGALAIDQPNARNENRYQLSPVVAYTMSATFAITAEAYHVIGGKNTIAGTTWILGIILSRK